MSSMIVTGKLPASFIPVEYALPPPCRTSSASSSSSSSSRLTRNYGLVDLLEPSYRYLLHPGRPASSTTKLAPSAPSSPSRASVDGHQQETIATGSPSGLDAASVPRSVRRKGQAYRSPPLEPALPHRITSAGTPPTTSDTSMSARATTSSTAGIAPEPLAYIGTINYQFILDACRTVSHSQEGSSSRSPPRNGESSQRSLAKSGKRKSGGAKNSDIWDWKGKGNNRSANDCPSKPKRPAAAAASARVPRVRERSEEPRARTTRPTRAASQQRQRNKSAETGVTRERTSPPPATAPMTRSNSSIGNKSGADGTNAASGGKNSSLVPPPASALVHQVHHLHPPPSPLRQSAIPVRLTETTIGAKATAAPMTRGASHGGATSSSVDPTIHATRGSKRRQSSVGPTNDGGEEEEDVSKRLRRALASSIPVVNPSLLAPASPKRASRATRPATRYATRSAPNSPPEGTAELFDAGCLDVQGTRTASRAEGRVGLRRTVSHPTLPDEPEATADVDTETNAKSRIGRDVSLPKNLRDYEMGIPA